VVVGNGAAELIKSLCESLCESGGKVGVVLPTFEEYPNRLPQNQRVAYIPQNADFSYTADDLIGYFSDKDVNALVLINPDNPSGNYIDKAGISKLLDWSKDKGITLIADESFCDFADEYPLNTLIDSDIISAYENLVVVKSISKSYGVPGLRLGVLVSSDLELIQRIKKDVAIWNINSFGEFYMQIEEKYKSDYEYSLSEMRKTRANFICDLNKTGKVRVIPSQSDFVTAEIVSGITAKELTTILLFKHGILIKDLSAKISEITDSGKQYVRIAVRNAEDNARLIHALEGLI